MAYTSLFTEVQQLAADKLNADPVLSAWGAAALCESSLDIEFEVKNALAKQGLACIVMAQNASYAGVRSGTDQSFTFDRLVVQLAEVPAVWRAHLKKAGFSSGSSPDVASRVFEVLGAFDESYKQLFCPARMEESVISGLLVTNCEFTCSFSRAQFKLEDYWTVTQQNIGEYDGITFQPAEPGEGQVKLWQQEDASPAATIAVLEHDEANGWAWVLTTREISIMLRDGPSPDEADTLEFNSPRDRLFMTVKRTKTDI